MLMFGRHALAGTALGLLMFLAGAHGQAPPQAPTGFPAFDLDAMFRERPILAQFDASKNGRLENDERKVAREWLAKQPPTGLGAVIGRFAGPGGPGSPGGPPPGMPPLGGRGLAPGSPGQRLSPDAVRTYRDEPFYDPTVLRTLFLQFENADWEKELSDFYNTDVDVPAVLTVDGRAYRDVGVRFRGMSSYAFVAEAPSDRSTCRSTSRRQQRLLGYRTLNLLNANSDPTFVRGVLYSHIARQYVPAAKSTTRGWSSTERAGGRTSTPSSSTRTSSVTVSKTRRRALEGSGSPIGRGGMAYLGENIDAYRGIYAIKSRDNEQSWRQADPDVQGAQRDADRRLLKPRSRRCSTSTAH
jgi:hypothetical protein